jgi:hypothetical protein
VGNLRVCCGWNPHKTVRYYITKNHFPTMQSSQLYFLNMFEPDKRRMPGGLDSDA